MSILRKWLRQALNNTEEPTNYRDTAYSSTALMRGDTVHSVHIHEAVNGFVIEYFGAPIPYAGRGMMPGGAERVQTLWIVSRNESLTEAIAKALVSAKLSQ